jgi:hypothetical protein
LLRWIRRTIAGRLLLKKGTKEKKGRRETLRSLLQQMKRKRKTKQKTARRSLTTTGRLGRMLKIMIKRPMRKEEGVINIAQGGSKTSLATMVRESVTMMTALKDTDIARMRMFDKTEHYSNCSP